MATAYYPSTPQLEELMRRFQKSSGLDKPKAHAALLIRGLEAAVFQGEVMPKLSVVPERIDELSAATQAIIDALTALHKSVDIIAKSQAALVHIIVDGSGSKNNC